MNVPKIRHYFLTANVQELVNKKRVTNEMESNKTEFGNTQ